MQRRIYYLLICILIALQSSAQIFPVQVQQEFTNLPARLSDFGSDPLNTYRLSLQLLDPFEPQVQVTLRVRIEGPNLRIRTSASAPPVIHQVDFGFPLQLSGTELAYLFAPGNLILEGISSQDFWRDGGVLPEGFYQVCIEAFLPARSDELGVSGEHCVPFFMNYQEPPLVTYPLANQRIQDLVPTSFAINWQDQSFGGLTNFDLEITPYKSPPGLIRLNDQQIIPAAKANSNTSRSQITPVQAFSNSTYFPDDNGFIGLRTAVSLNAPLLFRSGLNGFSYQLQPDDPALQPGRQYLVRVRAYDPIGTRVFRNGGWSQPVLFTYGTPCIGPKTIALTPMEDNTLVLSWEQEGIAPIDYLFRYKAKGKEEWQEVNVSTPSLQLDQLALQTVYNYELSIFCGINGRSLSLGTFTSP